MLQNVRVASPCSADWDQMQGDDRTRYCSACNLNVYNLSAMTEQEARELVTHREGRLCVRFYRRRDGRVLTRNCPVGMQAVVRRISRVAGAAFSAISVSFASAQTSPQRLVQINRNETGIAITVVDVQGAICANAQVELVNETSKTKTIGATNAEGQFRLPHLAEGPYVLTVRFQGFQTYTERVKVQEHKVLTSKITLQLGALMGVVIEVAPTPVSMIEPVSYPALELAPLQAMPAERTVRRGFFRRMFSTLGHKLGL